MSVDAKKALTRDGWRLVRTTPIVRSFHFERFVGRRRVAMVILVADTTPQAWHELLRLTSADEARAQ